MKRNADAFVDDSANGVSDAHLDIPMSMPEIVCHLQHTAQTWERILYSSGGALEILKCFWYLVYWEWPQGRPAMSLQSLPLLPLPSPKVASRRVPALGGNS